MQNKSFPLGSFANLSPCRQTSLTEKEARKKNMLLLRYAALGLANVVVAPATFWARAVLDTYWLRIGYVEWDFVNIFLQSVHCWRGIRWARAEMGLYKILVQVQLSNPTLHRAHTSVLLLPLSCCSLSSQFSGLNFYGNLDDYSLHYNSEPFKCMVPGRYTYGSATGHFCNCASFVTIITPRSTGVGPYSSRP